MQDPNPNYDEQKQREDKASAFPVGAYNSVDHICMGDIIHDSFGCHAEDEFEECQDMCSGVVPFYEGDDEDERTPFDD